MVTCWPLIQRVLSTPLFSFEFKCLSIVNNNKVNEVRVIEYFRILNFESSVDVLLASNHKWNFRKEIWILRLTMITKQKSSRCLCLRRCQPYLTCQLNKFSSLRLYSVSYSDTNFNSVSAYDICIYFYVLLVE